MIRQSVAPMFARGRWYSGVCAPKASSVLVVSTSSTTQQVFAQTVSAAAALGSVSVLVTGNFNVSKRASDAAAVAGVSLVLKADADVLAKNAPEAHAALLATLHAHFRFSHIIAPSSAHAQSILPRTAALLGVPMLTDAERIVDSRSFVVSSYAGAVLSTIAFDASSSPRILTLRPTAAAAAAALTPATTAPANAAGAGAERATAAVRAVPPEAIAAAAAAVVDGRRVLLEAAAAQDGCGAAHDLETARVVVGMGRGVGSAEGLSLMERLASRLGGTVGATRAAVDSGLVPPERQIGQTGKQLSGAQLYLAVGVGGAIQHMSGAKDAKVIAAINRDPGARIMKNCDVGLVMDGEQAAAELLRLLGEEK